MCRALISSLFWISHTASAADPFKIELKIEVTQELLKKQSQEKIEENLKTKIRKAQACLDNAFSKVKKSPKVTIQLKEIVWLNEEQNKRLGKTAFQRDLSEDGRPIDGIAGNAGNEVTAVFYSTTVNHVPWVFDQRLKALMQTKDFRPILKMDELNNERECKIHEWGETLSPEQAAILNDLKIKIEKAEINEAAAFKKLEAKGIDFTKFLISNRIRLESHLALESSDEGNTFAHELMHAFGGLIDTYSDPKNKAPNLMGAYMGGNECVLTAKQVESFVQFRTKTKK